MAHPSRNSLETFKQETGLHDVLLQGGDGSSPANCCLLWRSWEAVAAPARGPVQRIWQGCSRQDHRREGLKPSTLILIWKSLQQSLSPSERRQTISKGHRIKNSASIGSHSQSCIMGCCLQLPVQLRHSETTSLSVTLLSCDLNKALDGNKAVVFSLERD